MELSVAPVSLVQQYDLVAARWEGDLLLCKHFHFVAHHINPSAQATRCSSVLAYIVLERRESCRRGPYLSSDAFSSNTASLKAVPADKGARAVLRDAVPGHRLANLCLQSAIAFAAVAPPHQAALAPGTARWLSSRTRAAPAEPGTGVSGGEQLVV